MKNWSDEVKNAVKKLSSADREDILRNRKSFIMYTDKFPAIKKLSFDQIGKLFYNIMEYQSGEDITNFSDVVVEVIFEVLKTGFIDDTENYIHMTVKNKINRNKYKKNLTTGDQWSRQVTDKDTDNDTDTDNGTDKDTDNDTDTDNGTDKDTDNGTDKNNSINNNTSSPASLEASGSEVEDDDDVWGEGYGEPV